MQIAQNKHLAKSEQLWEKGYDLIHVFSNEFLQHPETVFNLIKQKLNIKPWTEQTDQPK